MDPIGLAGGLNAYGFANGDPVDFSDPFGLCSKADGYKDCDQKNECLLPQDDGPELARGIAAQFAGEQIFSAMNGSNSGGSDESQTEETAATLAAEVSEASSTIYRRGGTAPSNLTVRDGEDALSFRNSISNPIEGPVLGRPGEDYIGLSTAKLPTGSVTFDDSPHGHVSVRGVSVKALKDAVVVRGKFPK